MRIKLKISDILATLALAGALFFALFSLRYVGGPSSSEEAARLLEHKIDRQIEKLESYAEAAVSDREDWLVLKDFPRSMVIYKYYDDSLVTWVGEFPTTNDRIERKSIFPVLYEPQYNLESVLADANSEKWNFISLGYGNYLIKSWISGRYTVIAGLEVNPFYPPLSGEFDIRQLSEPGGADVMIDGEPKFRVNYNYGATRLGHNALSLWLFLLLMLASTWLVLKGHKSRKLFFITAIVQQSILIAVYLWGLIMGVDLPLFSPLLYAENAVFYSLAAVFLFNMAIFGVVLDEYICRSCMRINRVSKCLRYLFGSLIIFYCFFIFRSIIINSSITLEIFKIKDIDVFTGLVYFFFLPLLASPLLLVRRLDKLSISLYSACIGFGLVILTTISGNVKEQGRLELWANRLAVDRDIALELQLKAAEAQIASDPLVMSFAMMPNGREMIERRLTESYMRRIAQDYELSVLLVDPFQRSSSFDIFLSERMHNGSPIAEGSGFSFSISKAGHAHYTGLFSYADAEHRQQRYLVLNIEPKVSRQDRGYARIMGESQPGRVSIPIKYSYAKYRDGVLSHYRGTYPYATSYVNAFSGDDGYTHFVYNVSDNDIVVISKRKLSLFTYATAAMLLSLVMYFLILSMSFRPLFRIRKGESYYRRRISLLLQSSLVITLVIMAAVSVTFVYRRNNANLEAMMSDKITSLQGLVESRCRYAKSSQELNNQDFLSVLEMLRDIERADITLYTTDGRALMSTSSEFFRKSASGMRMNDKAFYNIVHLHRLYYVSEQRFRDRKYHSLYAPLFNDEGAMIAIVNSPYTEQTYDFERDAATHSVTIITLFLFLLIIARFLVNDITRRMFQPIVELSNAMNSSQTTGLVQLEYNRKDEISSLVAAYNDMVHNLEESTRELARVERDNAWSGMARSIAHEINNSLSPMKLQLQRLIRLKERNAPGWEERFDDVSKVILDQIEVLSDTATQFLTFAKLVSENHVDIDLDKLLKEQVMLFEGREGVELQYIGLSDAHINGPKPQFTRVVVNLLTNALQAIEENGGGHVVVSLRNSMIDGMYDIVVEDDGPGVSEENQSRLFTPNFTTKNSGTGIGLAICKSILDMCGATISYSRSFTLGGAAFTITYPKLDA